MAAAGLVYWSMTSHKAAAPDVALPAAATQPQTAITGNYADDWQTRCGPLAPPAQAGCTASLDAAYGRKAEAPLPKN